MELFGLMRVLHHQLFFFFLIPSPTQKKERIDVCHWQTLYVPVRLSSPYNHEPVPSSFQALFIIGVCVHLKVFVLGQHNACWAFLIARKTFSYLCVYSLQYGRRDSKQQCPVQTIFFFFFRMNQISRSFFFKWFFERKLKWCKIFCFVCPKATWTR